MKLFLLNIFLTIITCNILAQKVTINGSIYDTINHLSLKNSTIIILEAKDSSLYKYTISNSNGDFLINNVDTGVYILQVSYPGYSNNTKTLTIKNSNVDLGPIYLELNETVLENVVVSSKVSSINIKGDTLEFNAKYFKINPNENVESLLKKLPGIEIGKDGKITLQGEVIKQVLVDGEEFFGDDPILVTRNLRADLVDKVQVYNKKSELSSITNIDDGSYNKSLNLKLKSDKKNGYFGKVMSGGELNNFYEFQNMFNYFKGKNKYSFYATIANTGIVGLGLSDAERYGGGNSNVSLSDAGQLFIYSTNNENIFDSWNGNYQGKGLPKILNFGSHIDKYWDKDKQNLVTNLKVGNSSLIGNSQENIVNNLGVGQIQYVNNVTNFTNNLARQKGDILYKIDFDSSLYIRTKFNINLIQSSFINQTKSILKNQDSAVLNISSQETNASEKNKMFSSEFLIVKKMKKKGRIISFSIDQSSQKRTQNTLNVDSMIFYANSHTQITNKNTLIDNKADAFSWKLTYSEPINKNIYLGANIGGSISDNTLYKMSFNKDSYGRFNSLDSLYSNMYEIKSYLSSYGISYNYNENRIRYGIGCNMSVGNYNQINIFENSSLKRNLTNWYPWATFNLKFKNNANLNIGYNGNTVQPKINQLQPVFSTSDSLNIYEGNPNLNSTFNNHLRFNFDKYNIITNSFLGFLGGVNISTNPVITNIIIDTITGIKKYEYFNYQGKTFNFYLSPIIGSKIKKFNLDYQFFLNSDANTYITSINKNINKTISINFSVGSKFEKSIEKKYDISIEETLGYRYNHNTLGTGLIDDGLNFNLLLNSDVFISKRLQLHSSINYSWQQGTKAFSNEFNKTLLDAWIGERFGHQENILLKFSINDILNQNKGFSRQINENTYDQIFYTTIQRYMMISLVWDFNKMGKKK